MTERKRKLYRYVAVFMALNILAEVVSPTMAFALTGGPSQPEFESFEPADTNQMVDLFTGDFNYNIPLLTVPGPNGGYPVNLAYHAGIGMEQEASWVGLGWNINPGVINRNVRGLPDDFNGDYITKSVSLKPDVTWGVNADVLALIGTSKPKEVVGYEIQPQTYSVLSSLNGGINYNNYRGVGINADCAFSWGIPGVRGANFGFSVSYDSHEGMNLAPNIGLGCKFAQIQADVQINSYQGLTGYGYNVSISPYNRSFNNVILGFKNSSFSVVGQSFSVSSYIPTNQLAMTGDNVLGQLRLGKEKWLTFKYIPIGINYSKQSVTESSKSIKAYGYNYLENRSYSTEQTELSDYNKASESPITEDAPYIPMPVLTNDVYSSSAQGLGGVFRANRSDVTNLYEPSIISSTNGATKIEVEVGAVDVLHLGTNVDFVNTSDSYSGIWQGQNSSLSQYKPQTGDNNLYYRFNSELYTDEGSINNVNTINGAKRFQISQEQYDNEKKKKFKIPNVQNLDQDGNTLYSSNYRTTRKKSVNNIEVRTFGQIESGKVSGVYKGIGKHTYTAAETTPSNWSEYQDQFNLYDYSATSTKRKAHHNAEISVLNSSGYRYVYGIPVYNNEKNDVFFANGRGISSTSFNGVNGTSSGYATKTLTSYNSNDASLSNDEGIDNYYSSTKLPAYPYSYLLTAIYSPDYVDLTNDGPTEDDFGYFVKFNYEKKQDAYKWRVPFTDATLLKGEYSNLSDDKSSYTYGTKEVWYLNSIETKSHVAVFTLNTTDRADGRGAYTEHNLSSGTVVDQRTNYLDKIELFNKSDFSVPMKSVNFEYNYELCNGIQNGTSGKLTLKKVWFSYFGNNKGRLSPYIFDYDAEDSDANPNYSLNNTDRWGNYKLSPFSINSGYSCTVDDYPYTYQNNDYDHDNDIDSDDIDKRNKHASAWCLRKITLPSGGDITVNYEQDDYAYVQNAKATEMFEIVGTGEKDNGNSPSLSVSDAEVSGKRTRLYFNLKVDPANGNAIITDITKYLPEPDDNNKRIMYFKAYMDLKSTLDFSRKAYDYVDGYCEINAYGTQEISSKTYGWIEVNPVETSKAIPAKCHPFSKAGWQYLKNKRSDLLSGDASLGVGYQFLQSFINIAQDALDLIGFYTSCDIKGYAKKINLNAEKPSFLRLLNPTGHKNGGGYRVKSIIYGDNWQDMSTDTNNGSEVYGQEYSYVNPDGTSSGVATYEPIFGGEENPLKLPTELFSSVDGPKILRNHELYMETPIAEAYYPGASVGYGRVLVRSLSRLNAGVEMNTKSKIGVSVSEFYTAKDFPVVENNTQVYQETYKPSLIVIPLFGTKHYESEGFSQGYEIVLNDMNGKLWKQSTYAFGAGLKTVYGTNIISPSTNKPVSQVEYIYNTKVAFNRHFANQLNNSVTVLDGDGVSRVAIVGQTGEDFYETNEHYVKTFNKQGEVNIDASEEISILGIPFPFPSYWPYSVRNDRMIRTVATNHVVYQTGILKQVKTTVNGSTSTATNLMFDANTGTPLLTSVTNDFDKPVYSYNYPAYWAYDAMGGAYKNQGWEYSVGASISSGSLTLPATSNKFKEGDVLEVYLSSGSIEYCWVTAKTSTTLTLKDEYGSDYSSGSTVSKIKVLRSGYRNQQSAGMGQVVSLETSSMSGINAIFSAINNFTDTCSGCRVTYSFSVTNCDNKDKPYICNLQAVADSIIDNAPLSEINFPIYYGLGGGPVFACDLTLSLDDTISSLGAYSFYRYGNTSNKVEVVNKSTGQIIYGTITSGMDCLHSCYIQGVLHADATHYTDDWGFNYEDFGNPESYESVGSKVAMTSTLTAGNPYRFGTKGIWRPLNSWAYITTRNQNSGQTHNYEDGTYDKFKEHNWVYNEKILNPNSGSYSTSPSVTNNPDWRFVSENTVYNPYGYVVEKVNAIGNYSSALYGYQNSVQTAVTSNATYYETAFEGFEDHALSGGGSNYLPDKPGHGHLKFGTGSTPIALSSESHTGKFSYVVSTSGETFSCTPSSSLYFTPKISSKYIVSAWFKVGSGSGTPQISCSNGVSPILTLGPKIDGWQKVDYVFATDASSSTAYDIVFSFTSSTSGYVDDIRIQPYTSAMVTYVYNPITYWNVAELDNRNFATFYNYDSEGSLVQVKKETEKGIVTIKSARSNIRRNPTP